MALLPLSPGLRPGLHSWPDARGARLEGRLSCAAARRWPRSRPRRRRQRTVPARVRLASRPRPPPS
eukprot:7361502-Pyramimonas_sp.AAC.1